MSSLELPLNSDDDLSSLIYYISEHIRRAKKNNLFEKPL